MSTFRFRSYVAMGDSLTEGLGDEEFDIDRQGKGWADRLAGILACEAANSGQSFDYANLALRGSNSLAILTAQLERALELKPDLVTIMTGANDLVRLPIRRKMIQQLLRGAISRLQAVGAHVVLVNTVRPDHLLMARPMIKRSEEMSLMLAEIAREFDVPIVDVHSISEFNRLDYWAGDLVHFSHRGHLAVTNKVSEILGLELRDSAEYAPSSNRLSVVNFLGWFVVHVLPFWGRRLRGVNAGLGLSPKHAGFVRLVDAGDEQHAQWWEEADAWRATPATAGQPVSLEPVAV